MLRIIGQRQQVTLDLRCLEVAGSPGAQYAFPDERPGCAQEWRGLVTGDLAGVVGCTRNDAQQFTGRVEGLGVQR